MTAAHHLPRRGTNVANTAVHANPHSQRMSQRTKVIRKKTNAAKAPMTTRVQNHMPQSCVPCAQACPKVQNKMAGARILLN